MANRQSDAAKALEKAVALDPSRKDLQIQLASAYLKEGEDAKGLDALRRGMEAVSDAPAPNQAAAYNNAAWILAEAKKELPLAVDYGKRAVSAEEDACAGVQLESLKTADLAHAVALGMYWDTLGWVSPRCASGTPRTDTSVPRGT